MGEILLTLAHSPDPDDAFMWWPLVGIHSSGPEIDTGPYRFELITEDIETLNQRAEHAAYDITAISCAQYPRVREQYALTACGASLGDGYGPRIVSRAPLAIETFRSSPSVTAIPGTRTSAVATCRLLLNGAELPGEVVPFDEIIHRVKRGDFETGLVIHEGQLTFGDSGLHLVADLGTWWKSQTGLPLPLGGNAIRRDLEERAGGGALQEVAALLKQSVLWAMEHKDRAVEWAMNWGRGIDRATAEQFVDMYVNKWTVDVGREGSRALEVFFERTNQLGILPEAGNIDIIGRESESS